MSGWFRRREPVAAPIEGSAPAAYQQGRRDESRLRHEGEAAVRDRDEGLERAYERGRRDGMAQRRRSPMLSFLVLLVVAVGALLIYLAIRNGSFAGGGEVVDRNISTVTQAAKAPIAGAADKAGDALQDAGAGIKQRAAPAAP